MALLITNKQAAEDLRRISNELIAISKKLALRDFRDAAAIARQAGKLDYIAEGLEAGQPSS